MTRRIMLPAALLLAASTALVGCTPPVAEPTAWQSIVQTVGDQASAGDYTSARATLDALEADVVARRDAGDLSAAEADGILSRIDTVRVDLTSLTSTPTPTAAPTAEATPTPTPAPTAEQTPDEQPTVSDDGGSVDEAPGNSDDRGPGGSDKEKGPGKGDPSPGSGGGSGKKDG